jgi:hypothetical protein
MRRNIKIKNKMKRKINCKNNTMKEKIKSLNISEKNILLCSTINLRVEEKRRRVRRNEHHICKREREEPFYF